MNSGATSSEVHKKKTRSAIFVFLVLALGLVAPSRARGQAIDLSRLVVVGDSLAAGVENGSLEDAQQEHGFANVIAQQAGVPLVLPLVPAPGIPNTLELVSSQFPPVIEQVPGSVPFPRDDPFANITDLAVPGQGVADALNLPPNTNFANSGLTQLATDLVLGFPCPIPLPCPALTQVQRALLLRPTALIVDLGNNDILGVVSSGRLPALLADPSSFLTNFNNSYSALLSSLALAGAPLIVGNIPDITEVPQLLPVWKLVQAQNLPLLPVLEALGVGPLDYVTLPAVPAVEAILSGSTPGPLPVSCIPATPAHPCVVTFEQVVGVRLVTIEMNLIVQVQAALHKAVVVDLFSLIDNLHANGYKVGKFSLTTDYLGGLFSLDGLHPSNTGYGIMANEFIKDINAAFHTQIPPADILQIAEHDPLILP